MPDISSEKEIDEKRGDNLSNSWTTERFTCPICLTDIDVEGMSERMAGEQFKYKRCECGAPLSFEIVMAPEAKCTVMDKDDEEEHLTGGCEACDDKEGPFCEGCGCCAECCNCTETDCDCDVCVDRREGDQD